MAATSSCRCSRAGACFVSAVIRPTRRRAAPRWRATWWRERRRFPELATERLALRLEPALEPAGAVAVAAGPRLGAVLIAAPASRVRVLHRNQLEILFPVRALFGQRRGAEAGFHPLHAPIGQLAGLGHVAKVFSARHRAPSERTVLNGAAKRGEAARPEPGSNQISHGVARHCTAGAHSEVRSVRLQADPLSPAKAGHYVLAA